jgi:hypothetical protein
MFPSLGAAYIARMPMSTMTMTSSMMVKPRDFRLRISDRVARDWCGLLGDRKMA